MCLAYVRNSEDASVCGAQWAMGPVVGDEVRDGGGHGHNFDFHFEWTRGHQRLVSREGMWFVLGFNRIPLAAEWRMDCESENGSRGIAKRRQLQWSRWLILIMTLAVEVVIGSPESSYILKLELRRFSCGYERGVKDDTKDGWTDWYGAGQGRSKFEG